MENQMRKHTFHLAIASSVFFLTTVIIAASATAKNDEYKLLLPSSEYPVSYDPLDADTANNIDHMKLRYFSPMEVDEKDQFRSSVLQSFDYDPKSQKMTWKVRKDLKFSDGTPLGPKDIILAIKRMGLARSGFPVLNSIVGIEEWSKKKHPLTQYLPGIITNDETIIISFARNVPNPYFHFSLALFAIQPSRCFDLKSSKNLCDVPPASGYYDFLGKPPKLSSKKGETDPVKFVLRKGFRNSGGFKLPEAITLEYHDKDLPDLVRTIDEKSVIRTMDSRLTDEFINQFRSQVHIQRLPRTGIWYLILNPTAKAFTDKTCRRIFANTYRKLYGDRVKSVKVATKSFSSPIMPGYLTNDQLEKLVPTNDNNCIETFRKNPIKFKATYPFWTNLLKDTMNALEMPTTGILEGEPPSPEFARAFVSGESDILNALVSFWPLDLPSGFSMFFSPNMHPELSHLLKDGKLTDLSSQLFIEKNPETAKDYFEKINVLLYEEAQLNALSYLGMAYISKSTNVNSLPIATSEPNPWHLFNVK
jgi:ABC-type transport system substrate-binding protein